MSRQIRVLFIRSNPIQPDPRVEKSARALAWNGYQVDILAWDRDGIYPALEERKNFSIYRIKIKASYGSGLRNLLHLGIWQFREFLWLLRNSRKYQVFHVCDFDTALPAILMKALYGQKIVYDIFDFYADHIRNTPGWIKALIRKMEQGVIQVADGVILADESRKTQIQTTELKNLIVINNTPQDVFDPRDMGTRVRDERWQLKILYVGLLQKERGLITLLNILQEAPAWHLDLAGFGGDEEQIIEIAEKMPNVTFHGRINYDTTLELGKKADVYWALYDPAVPNHRYASPNKLFEAMMLRKPVIVAKGTYVDELVEKYRCGLVVDYNDRVGIPSALELLSQNSSLNFELSQNSRKAYEQHYHWNIMETRILNMYSVFKGK